MAYFVCVMLGAIFGYTVCALMVISKEEDND